MFRWFRKPDELLEFRLAKISPTAGDTLIFEIDKEMSQANLAVVRDRIQEKLPPGVNLLVFAGAKIKISWISKDAAKIVIEEPVK